MNINRLVQSACYLTITAAIFAQIITPTYALFSSTSEVIESKISAAFVFPRTILKLEENIKNELANVDMVGLYDNSVEYANSEEIIGYINEIEQSIARANVSFQIAMEIENELNSYHSIAIYEAEKDKSAIILLEMIESSLIVARDVLNEIELRIKNMELTLTIVKIDLERKIKAEEEARIEKEKEMEMERQEGEEEGDSQNENENEELAHEEQVNDEEKPITNEESKIDEEKVEDGSDDETIEKPEVINDVVHVDSP